MTRQRIGTMAAVVTIAFLLAPAAAAEDTAGSPEGPAGQNWLTALDTAADVAELAQAAPAASPPEWGKPIPLSFTLDYTLVTDYIWRGINYSEYDGEGREALNHQLGVGASYDTGTFGTFGMLVWLEWYADQEALSGPGSGPLQEVDYVAYWSYTLEQIATTVETGWIAYAFPQVEDESECTHEWYVALSFDDSCLFGTEQGVLNPFVAYYLDVDDVQGSWLEFGVSHDFILAEMGCKDTPVLKDLSVTPSFVVGVDHRYLPNSLGTGQEATRLANLRYGLAATYDITSALSLPPQVGLVTLTGFLNFSQALRDELIDDEFWGGVTVAWQW